MATPARAFILRTGDREEPVATLQQLEAAFNEARQKRYADLWLIQRRPPMTGISAFINRLLGLSTEVTGPSVSALLGPEGAAVVFLDENFSERRVLNAANTEATRVRFQLANGQESLVDSSEVVGHDVALSAFRHFFEQGAAPASLRYRPAT